VPVFLLRQNTENFCEEARIIGWINEILVKGKTKVHITPPPRWVSVLKVYIWESAQQHSHDSVLGGQSY